MNRKPLSKADEARAERCIPYDGEPDVPFKRSFPATITEVGPEEPSVGNHAFRMIQWQGDESCQGGWFTELYRAEFVIEGEDYADPENGPEALSMSLGDFKLLGSSFGCPSTIEEMIERCKDESPDCPF